MTQEAKSLSCTTLEEVASTAAPVIGARYDYPQSRLGQTIRHPEKLHSVASQASIRPLENTQDVA